MLQIWKKLIFVSGWFLLIGCHEREAYQYLDQAVQLEKQGDREAALIAFQSAVNAFPNDAFLHRRLGWAFLRQDRFEDARVELERSIDLEPDYVVAYQDLAMLAEIQEMPETAMGWLETAIERVPGYPDRSGRAGPYRDLARLYLGHDRLDEAMDLLSRVTERWEGASWAHYSLGILYQQLKWPEKAVASFQAIQEIEPRTEDDYQLFVDSHGALGNIYYDQEKYDQAISFYQQAIELNRQDHSSLNNLAWVYAIQGKHLEEGIRLSHRSLRLQPDRPGYLDTLSELYYQKGDAEGAMRLNQRALDLAPDDLELQDHLQKQKIKFLSAGGGKV